MSGFKLSIAANYKVSDPNLATNKVDNYYSALYTVLQLDLREIVGTVKIEDLLEKRNQIGAQLLEACKPKSGGNRLGTYICEYQRYYACR